MNKRKYYIIAFIIIICGFFPFSSIKHIEANKGRRLLVYGEWIETVDFPEHDDIEIKWWGINLYTDTSGWQRNTIFGNNEWTRTTKVHPIGITISLILILLILVFPFIYDKFLKKGVDLRKESKANKETLNKATELKEYKFMLDEGLITKEEYEAKKLNMINSINK